MVIYSKELKKKSNKKWFEVFEKYENIIGLEPLYQDDIDSRLITMHEAWYKNINHAEDILAELTNIKIPQSEINGALTK